ncbi:hypothetical protein LELG_03120 [Lodderomyces elongisporus NRRL YB-4239]|uniref:Transmembrane protein n=1 Tax=Lodderomyces elongisporus (strain ATCC 11503 / CBS 2605 / JCM 1781 / NBRC 1676 / NRRL YB-4239) TaxID=379508 RepID=A5E0I3_LODEL|nr:hypothetical protein LELG_03120 [Lodderomyces elongisporus NRRL YB-4239]
MDNFLVIDVDIMAEWHFLQNQCIIITITIINIIIVTVVIVMTVVTVTITPVIADIIVVVIITITIKGTISKVIFFSTQSFLSCLSRLFRLVLVFILIRVLILVLVCLILYIQRFNLVPYRFDIFVTFALLCTACCVFLDIPQLLIHLQLYAFNFSNLSQKNIQQVFRFKYYILWRTIQHKFN